jgi:hypothetical protein
MWDAGGGCHRPAGLPALEAGAGGLVQDQTAEIRNRWAA